MRMLNTWVNIVLYILFYPTIRVKVTRSLTLVSYEKDSFVKYACQYEVSISYGSKVITKVKFSDM